MSKDTDNESIVKKRRTRQFLTPNSSFRPTGGFPSSSRLQSFQRPATCVNPLQKLRLDSSPRSLLLYQLEERRPTERTRAKV